MKVLNIHLTSIEIGQLLRKLNFLYKLLLSLRRVLFYFSIILTRRSNRHLVLYVF